MKNRIIWFINNVEEIIAGAAITVMLCSVGYNVLMRYIFRAPTSWSDEMSIIALAYVTFVGSAAAYKKNQHFGMDYLVDSLPKQAKLLLRRVINFVLILLFAFLAYLSVMLIQDTTKLLPYTRWSYNLLNVAVALGFISMSAHAVIYFVQSFHNPEKFQARYEAAYESSELPAGDGVKIDAEPERDAGKGENGK